MKELKPLNKYFYRYRYRLMLGIACLGIANFFLVSAPVFVGKAIDGLGNLDTTVKETVGTVETAAQSGIEIEIYENIALALACSFLFGFFLFLVRQSIIVGSRKIEYDMKNDIYSHIQALSLSSIRQMNTGDLMSRATSDLNAVRSYFGPCFMYCFNSTFRMIFAVSAMAPISLSLSIYALLPSPLLAYIVFRIGKEVRVKSQYLQEANAKLTSFVQESLSGIRVVKLFVKERYQIKEFSKINNHYFRKSMDVGILQSCLYAAMSLLLGISTLITIWVGGGKTIQGEISLGMLVQFMIYISVLSWPIISIGWITNMIQKAIAAQTRLNALLSIQPDIVDEKTVDTRIQSLSGTFEFKNVSFSYSPGNQSQTLSQVSFKIKAGEKIAIVGPTGSGKTTFLELIPRLLDATNGDILFDEVSIKNIPISTLRKNIAFTSQDNFLFSTTLQENIAFGASNTTNQSQENLSSQVLAAAKASDIYKDIVEFPKGFETFIGERGVTLSGGQKQRTSMARSLIRHAPILILDDSLSSVDAKTEDQILNNIFSEENQATTLFATHRISAAKRCDRIFLFDQGTISDTGTHDELLEKNSVYVSLYKMQLLQEQALEL